MKTNNKYIGLKRLLFAGLLLLSIACKHKIPGNIIQPDKMASVLYDIHIADGYVGSIPNPDSGKRVAAAYYKGIYKRFAIDSVVYVKSMNYYAEHPDALSAIYVNVTASLKKTKDSLDKITQKALKAAAKKAKLLKKDTVKKDSLKKDSVTNVAGIKENAAAHQPAKAIKKTDTLKKVVKKRVSRKKKYKRLTKAGTATKS